MKNYDPGEDTQVAKRKLPHWQQLGCLYFVTFRLKDSIPKAKLVDWNERRERWLRSRGIHPEISSSAISEKLSDQEKVEYYQTFTSHYHNLLDNGMGECLLRDPQNAQIIADALLFFDKDRYHMWDFVIMPNHVHLLVELFENWKLPQLLQTWKRFAAREINKRIGRTGSLWQREYYDHIVRNEPQMQRIQKYIKNNPKNLKPNEYIYRTL